MTGCARPGALGTNHPMRISCSCEPVAGFDEKPCARQGPLVPNRPTKAMEPVPPAPCLARLLTSRLARTLAPPKKLETAINKNSEMKTNNLFLLPVLIAALAWMLFGRVTAQTYINRDGANPYAGLILLSNTLYG